MPKDLEYFSVPSGLSKQNPAQIITFLKDGGVKQGTGGLPGCRKLSTHADAYQKVQKKLARRTAATMVVKICASNPSQHGASGSVVQRLFVGTQGQSTFAWLGGG